MGTPTILYCDYANTSTATVSLTGNGNGSDVLIATEDTFYSPLATNSFDIVIYLGGAELFDAVAILGANLNGVTMEVRASTDNFVASDVSISAASALVSDVNAAWRTLTPSTYAYVKLLFSGHASDLRIAHICLMAQPSLPYFETDPDIDNVTPTGVQLVSQSGQYIGSNQQRAMREMSLDWGEVTAAELAPIKLFAESCIKVINPFYFIPDITLDDCFFGWIPSGGNFASPQTPGVYTIPAINFTTRAA